MKKIPLTRGCVALVDDDDYERLRAVKWRVLIRRRAVYAVRSGPRPAKATIYMHREILPGGEVDHVWHDPSLRTVDNRRSNLRLVVHASNQAHQRKTLAPRSSIFKGVCWRPERKRWRASICKAGRQKHLGYFRIEAHAALVYDLAAVRLFGEYALTNFPIPGATALLDGKP